MNVLEKILEEIKQYTEDVYECDLDDIVEYQRRNREDNCTYIVQGIEEATEFIRSHMDDVPKCGECSRRKFYMQGYEDGRKMTDGSQWKRDCQKKRGGINVHVLIKRSGMTI